MVRGHRFEGSQVRSLSRSPRIHVFCRHVETRRKCPLTAGFSNASFGSPGLRKGRRPISDLSLCGKKSRSWRRKGVVARASPRSCRCWMRTASEICKCEEVESGLGQTEPLKLQRPFVRRITQVGDADAARTSRVQLKPIGGPVAYSISRLVLALEMLAWAHSVLYKDIL